jgi:phage recombination protein Bet
MEEKNVVRYEAKDGQNITLSFETIKRYLVQGRSEYVTAQEMIFFMGVCRSRGLNPFNKDCYLIKYSQGEGAAIVTSVDYFRKRARAQKDCKGWKKGIIVERNGDIIHSNGLMLQGDKLLGGWFKAKPDGWDEPFEHEVNLGGYIKHTKEGKVTRFWSEENQPSQIAKVAESQGLRILWPDEFQQLYTPEEIGDASMFKDTESTLRDSDTPAFDPEMVKAFDNLIPGDADRESVDAYIRQCADHFGKTVETFKETVIDNKEFDAFWEAYQKTLPKKDPDEEFIALFKHLRNKEKIKEFELAHRETLAQKSEKVRKEFAEKWKRTFDQGYSQFLESLEPPQGATEGYNESSEGNEGQSKGEKNQNDSSPDSNNGNEYIFCPEHGSRVAVKWCQEKCALMAKCQKIQEYLYENQ